MHPRQTIKSLTSDDAHAANRKMGFCSAGSNCKVLSSPYHHMSTAINGSDNTLL